MRTYTRPLVASLVAALVLILASPVYAGAPTDTLKGTVDRIVQILADPALQDKPEQRRAEVRKIAEGIFDYPDTARRALGPHWSARSPQEQQEFAKLFADLLDRAYVSKIELYQGERVRYVGETADGDEATVKTVIATKKSSDIPVDYRMHRKDGRWLVYDVIIEGVSLVSNYRTQFNKIVQTESYDALILRLRAKDTAEPSASPARPRSDR
ncbi:MAG: organic solvent tolerance ABC transporter substrate-binding protein [Candidatus Rokuibacteriota bacterium]|nr:MAG: organic solvent tolerance ABC transporter substrate-binding protein [Candidatus Rokubacteria bacterium]